MRLVDTIERCSKGNEEQTAYVDDFHDNHTVAP